MDFLFVQFHSTIKLYFEIHLYNKIEILYKVRNISNNKNI